MLRQKLYFKNDWHEEDFDKLIIRFKESGWHIGETATIFSYLIAASGKADSLIDFINDEDIDIQSIKNKIGVYSSSEQALIRFAIQLYDSNSDDIILSNVFAPLDPNNERIVHTVIKIVFPIR